MHFFKTEQVAMNSHNTTVVVSIGAIDKTLMRSHGKNLFLQNSTVGMLNTVDWKVKLA